MSFSHVTEFELAAAIRASIFPFSAVFLVFPQICTAEVEVLMTRLQNTFRQELSGVGASLEKRWKFCGFDGLKMT